MRMPRLFRHLIVSKLLFASFLSCTSVVEASDIRIIPTADSDVQLIAIVGEFQIGDEKKFANLAIQTKSAVVVLSSPGGAIYPAIEIGNAIRIKGFVTYVAEGGLCASACALTWLGGRKRSMSSKAKIGFHAAYAVSDGLASVDASSNALVGAYVSKLGLPTEAVVYVTSAPPSGMRWLTPSDAKAAGLDMELLDFPPPPANASVEGNTGAVQAPSIEQRAATFVEEFLIVDSSSDPNSTLGFTRRFGDFVSYYGKLQSSEAVATDHAQFLSRWPKRSQNIRSGSLKVQCDSSSQKCQVSALIDWVAESEARNARSSGSSTWELSLASSATGFIIISINGKVLDRHISELRAKGPVCLFGIC
jgi:ATP-dependent protease ClpP protease subunit